MKKILLLGRDAETLKTAAKNLTDDKTLVEVEAYENLAFWIEGAAPLEAAIFCHGTKREIKDYDRVIVLSTSLGHAENYVFSALACYCRYYNVEMLDDKFTNLDGKLYAMWRFWEKGISIPKTAFGPKEFLAEKLTALGGVAVLKSVQGTKGKDNYLVHSVQEIEEILEQYTDADGRPTVRFVLQEFIPNDGDYRIVVINNEPKLAIYRHANGDDFRNNTSLGGAAKLVPLEEVDATVLDMAQRAAEALEIKIAGADILQNKDTGAYAILEVNRTPQLVSGAFVEEKMQVLKGLIV